MDEIRRLGADDMADVARLEALCFPTPWSEEQLRDALNLPHFIVYGLKRQGSLVSYVSLGLAPGELEVLNLATSPEQRRGGLARQLLQAVIKNMVRPEDEDGPESAITDRGDWGDEGAELPVERVILEVRVGNVPARALYDSLGFKTVGRRRAYYQDNGEDALIMSLELNA